MADPNMADDAAYTETWERNQQELSDYEAHLSATIDESKENVIELRKKLEISKNIISEILYILENLKSSVIQSNNKFRWIKRITCFVSLASTPFDRIKSGVAIIGSGIVKYATERFKSGNFEDNKELFKKELKRSLKEINTLKEIAGNQLKINSKIENILKSIREESCLRPFLTFDQAQNLTKKGREFNNFILRLNCFPQIIDPEIQKAMLVINRALIDVIENNYKVVNTVGTMFTSYVPPETLDILLGAGMFLGPPDGVAAMKGLNIVLNLLTLLDTLEPDADTESLVEKIDQTIKELNGDLKKIDSLTASTEEQVDLQVQGVLGGMRVIRNSFNDHSHLRDLLRSDAMARMRAYLDGV